MQARRRGDETTRCIRGRPHRFHECKRTTFSTIEDSITSRRESLGLVFSDDLLGPVLGQARSIWPQRILTKSRAPRCLLSMKFHSALESARRRKNVFLLHRGCRISDLETLVIRVHDVRECVRTLRLRSNARPSIAWMREQATEDQLTTSLARDTVV